MRPPFLRMTFTIVAGLALVCALLAIVTALGSAAIDRRHPPAGRMVPVAGGHLHVLELGTPGATNMVRIAFVGSETNED